MKTNNRKQELRNHKLTQMSKLIKESIKGFSTYQELALALNEPLEDFGISFSRQIVWAWGNKQHLPYPTSFKVLSRVAEEGTLPKRFADRALEILALEETVAQKSIRELGYDAPSEE